MHAVASHTRRLQTAAYRPLRTALRERGWVERPRVRVRVSGTSVWAYPPSAVRQPRERAATTYFQTRLHLEPDLITLSYAGIVANDDVVLHGTSTHPLCRRYFGALEACAADVLDQLDQIEAWRYDDGRDPNGRLFLLFNDLHFSLEERGWQWCPRWNDFSTHGDTDEDPLGEEFVDWIPDVAEWQYDDTLTGIDTFRAQENHVHPATVYADEQGLVLDPAGTNWACTRHAAAMPALSFPPDAQGLAALLAALRPYEHHKIDGEDWTNCARDFDCSTVPGRPARDYLGPPRRTSVVVPAIPTASFVDA